MASGAPFRRWSNRALKRHVDVLEVRFYRAAPAERAEVQAEAALLLAELQRRMGGEEPDPPGSAGVREPRRPGPGSGGTTAYGSRA